MDFQKGGYLKNKPYKKMPDFPKAPPLDDPMDTDKDVSEAQEDVMDKEPAKKKRANIVKSLMKK